ncbi:protein-lysine methyltransferase METTL21C-like isoform X2 [Gouania willdenowi]|uniref:protein-lysine methyltransferase METTL21C-like isoform X2 n=1 Tax=Gouania willdenowi TaxID=441366 RepID=UPI001056ACA7|nr:protein-lysine methyltransferase METTL21C-like isoform X2 [Gouania willdenowi]
MEGRKKAEEPLINSTVVEHRAMAGEELDNRKICEQRVYDALGKESFYFVGYNICIQESMDVFGALIWPGAIALCQFLENNQQEVNLKDKAVLEIGAGTGLLSVVASLLGASVTATDLPDLLPNLTFNLLRNTKGRSRYTPRVAVLSWGQYLDRDFPYPSYSYDYVLAADVVYHHNCLEDLLKTMHHFCRPGSQTTLLWANKVRFQSDVWFAESFRSNFKATLLAELPEQEVWIYKATAKE